MQTVPVNAALPGVIPQTAGYMQGTTGGEGIGFEAMLMQMLGGDAGAMEGEFFGQNAQAMLAQLQGKDQKDVTSQAAMEMMGAMFLGAPTMLSVDLNPSPMAYQNGSQTEAAIGVAETIQTMSSAAQTMQLHQDSVQAAMSAVLADPSVAELFAKGGGSITPSATQYQSTQAEMDELPTPQTQAGGSFQLPPEAEALLTTAKGETLTLDPIQSAQLRLRQMEKGNGQSPDEALAQLQAATGTPTTQATQTLPTTAERISHEAILQQVETGIRQHMKAGDSEFTLKLRPEGLGEIVVKLVEKQGKMSLSIITSTQQAQTALSSQIGALREALQPYEVQVTQVVSQQSLDFQQSMTQQQQRQQQQQQQNQPRWTYREEQESPQAQQQYAQTLNTALNTYI